MIEKTAQKIILAVELWDQIRARAADAMRTISNQIAYDLKKHYESEEAKK